MIRQMLLALLLLAAPIEVMADLAASFNAVRHHGCTDKDGTFIAARDAQPLRQNRKLDAVARRLSRSEDVHAAQMKEGYREAKSALFRMRGVAQDVQVEPILSRQFCSQITDAGYREIGTYRNGSDVWAIIAAPFLPPTPRQAAAIGQRVLELTNAARASARQCGREPFGAAPPLTLSPTLERAAMAHSKDMAEHDLFDHIGSDQSGPADRVTRAGYRWRMIGENIAGGITSPEEVVAGWLNSPHHCENIMGPRYAQMGVAYYYNPRSTEGLYWTQVFGTPAK